MSLLQQQDFVLYRIRNRYLSSMRDGVGERLITVNPTALNVPAFKNAGWGSPAEIRRTCSPPIPVGAASEYFTNNHPRSINDNTTPGVGGAGAAGDDGSGSGLFPRASNESQDLTTGKVPKGDSAGKAQRRMREHREDDDSSDMSDDSDMDDENTQGPTQKIHFDFSKKELPQRPRSGSSPIRSGPQVLVTSPSKSRTSSGRIRGGSHGQVDFSHKNDTLAAHESLLSSGLISDAEKIHAEIAAKLRSSPNSSLPHDSFGEGDYSDDSDSNSSEFTETAESNPAVIGNSLSPPIKHSIPSSPEVLHALPPPIRPISMLQPVSALTQMIKARQAEAANPMESYRFFSGKGELTPATLKLYIPISPANSPFEIVINRLPKQQEGNRSRETTVAEAIGFALYRYIEEKKLPALAEEQCDINRWTFRMVEDGEPDEDFPPLERTQPVTAFFAKRGRGGRGPGGARNIKLEGDFALVEATPEQYLENERVTPNKNCPKKSPVTIPTVPVVPSLAEVPGLAEVPAVTLGPSVRQAATEAASSFNSGVTNKSTPRTGPSKILRIHLSTIDEFSQSVSVCVTSDTYIAEVLEQVCRKKHLDKSKYILRVTGAPQTTIAPLDRTVASLGERGELDLVQRKFVAASEGLGDRAGSPSTVGSPNAPLIIGSQIRTPNSKSKGKFLQTGPWASDMLNSRDYLKFAVWRKASMSFLSRHERILSIDGEYVHIMPSEQKTLFESNTKTNSIHFSTIIGCKTYRKAPSNFKILVLRPQRETKRYDFEAVNEEQAAQLVTAVRRGMQSYRIMDRG